MKFENFFLLFNSSKDIQAPHLFYWWLIVAIAFLILEMGHPGLFFFLSFFFGGIIAAFSTGLTSLIMLQMVFFLGGTIMAAAILRYWGIGFLSKNRSQQQTNVYALKGKRAIVKQDIAAEKAGLVTIGGQVWAARVLHHDDIVRQGDIVEVVDVRGAHVVVRKI